MRAIGRHVSRLTGYAPALPTPFDDDDAIDYGAFERFCELQVMNGATALVVCGTTGEAPNLTTTEHCELIQIAAGLRAVGCLSSPERAPTRPHMRSN